MGSIPYLVTASVRSRNFSVIASMNKYGMIMKELHNGPINKEFFVNYIVNLKSACIDNGIESPVFIMDNAKIHHYKLLKSKMSELNLEILYLLPYSPFLNPIENVFSKWKNHIIRGNAKKENELFILINEGFESITENDCNGFIRNMLHYVAKSLQKELIH
ncbi:uncharacterized protein LOC115229946 [Octopus sinensis]|uniref:Uncharacterized protein LOC115229946 n=1 Tax=Octopus sinensis TaxID=2607531 RepID=A0A6P7U538_9MOLL|nr:uncharacterized protein LOC115229946 [Octopus sinensis]